MMERKFVSFPLQLYVQVKLVNPGAPLKLDNPGLLFWVRYHQTANIQKMQIYDDLETLTPAYKELRENTALFDRLRGVLEADELVREMHQRVSSTLASPFSFFHRFGRRYKAQKRNLIELIGARKKAYEEYEMLRRLSYVGDDGALFVLEFTITEDSLR
jgi:hypothetical protein